jgi:hypothetical protein
MAGNRMGRSNEPMIFGVRMIGLGAIGGFWLFEYYAYSTSTNGSIEPFGYPDQAVAHCLGISTTPFVRGFQLTS